MSRRKDRLRALQQAPIANTDKNKGLQVVRADDWASVATGIGTATRDKRLSYNVSASYRWTRSELLDLYKGDPVIARIVDDRAKEMLRKWFSLSLDGDDDGEQARAVMDAINGIDGLHLRNQLFDWLRWSRLFGGCALYMGVTDGRSPSEPLDLENVQSFDFLNVIDCYSIRPYSYYAGRLLPNFGAVYHYEVDDGLTFGMQAPGQPKPKGGTQLVHASRIIRADGVRLDPADMLFLNGWGDSVLTRVRQVVRDDALTWDSLAILMQEYSTAVVKMKGLAEALTTPGGKQIVQARMEGVQLARSMARLTLLDAGDEGGDSGEEWGRDTISLAGVADVIDRFMQRTAMAADMPVTRLWGISPGGMNATGESDTRNYYDSIEGDQETVLLPALYKLLQVLLRAQNGPTGGAEPPQWSIKCNPLRTMSAKEQAELEKIVAEKDAVYIDKQVLDPREVAQSRYGGPEYSTQTKLDDEVRALMEEALEAETEASGKQAAAAAEGAEASAKAAKAEAGKGPSDSPANAEPNKAGGK